MIPLSQRAQALRPSPTLAISARAAELRRAGEKVFSLAAGQPDFPTPEPIRRAALAALEAGHTGYAPAGGVPELRTALRRWARERLGLDYGDDQVVVGCGAKQCLANAALALLDPGDRAAAQVPYWVSYPEQFRLCGAEPVLLPPPSDGRVLNLATLRAEAERGLRLLVLNSPANPSGAIVSAAELDELAELVERYGFFVVSDDIYDRLVYDGVECPHLLRRRPGLRDRVVVVNGVSKAYSMTGWRLGWALGPAELIAAMRKLQDQTTSNAVTFVQHAAVAALESSPSLVADMVAEFARRRERVCRLLERIPAISYRRPQGAFYVMVEVKNLLGRSLDGRRVDDTQVLAELLLEHQRVAVVPGEAFGAPGWLRLSFAAALADLEQALERLAHLVAELH